MRSKNLNSNSVARQILVVMMLMLPLIATLTASMVKPLELTECFEKESEKQEKESKTEELKTHLISEDFNCLDQETSRIISFTDSYAENGLNVTRSISTPPPECA